MTTDSPPPSQIIAGLEDGSTQLVRTFKRDRRTCVDHVRHADGDYVIKQYFKPSPVIWLQHWVQLTPAWREIHAIRKLHEHGFRVNLPLMLHHTHGFTRAHQLLLFPFIEGHTLADWLMETEDASHRATVLRAVGRQMGELTALGATNRDHKARNLMIDAACYLLVKQPERFDVVAAPNQYGDIFSDLGAGLIGSLGLAPGANIGRSCAVFEASHGAAPDIAGQNRANPIALILSGALLLRHCGHAAQARAIEHAVHKVVSDPSLRTPDLGGAATTIEVAQAIAAAVHHATSAQAFSS